MEWNDSIENPEEKKKVFEDLIKKNPKDAHAYYELGVVCDYMHDFTKAIQHCQKAIALDLEENTLFHAFLVYLYSQRNFDEDKALEAAANLAELGPDEGDYYIQRAMDSLATISGESAYAYITKLIEQDRNAAAKNLTRWIFNP
jgi:tetratricopeptide (TPR) repeat protein